MNQVDQLGEVLVLTLLWNKDTAKTIIGDQNTLLTNGVRGSLKHTDFEWSTWNKNNDISFTIDLLENTKINKVMEIRNTEITEEMSESRKINILEMQELYEIPISITEENKIKEIKQRLGAW